MAILSATSFAVFVAGAIDPHVSSVRVSLGAGTWVRANIVTPPQQLEFPFRLFYVEAKAGFQIFNSSLPVVALDGHGLEIGRGSYNVRGG